MSHALDQRSTTTTTASTFTEPGTAFMRLAGLDGAPGANAASARSTVITPRVADEHLDVVVIGGGQAGLSVGYHLQRRGVRFAILDGSARIGDAWRKRWDSLKLFSPAWLDSLDGLPFPAPSDHFPTKDEMADYLEQYAAHFELPVRSSTQVRRLFKRDGRFVIETNRGVLSADQVIVAMASFRNPRVPAFASQLAPGTRQLHSSEYKNPAQLAPGSVLVVGGGNSGAEIAHELSRTHQVVMTAPDVGEVPFDNQTWFGREVIARFVMRVVFHRVLTIRTPMGRKARPTMMLKATPLIRVRAATLKRDGVERIGQRVTGAADGAPVIDGERTLQVDNVVWCSGYEAGQSWIDLPIFDDAGHPMHEAGVVTREPGLFFVGLPFLYSMSSAMIHGVGRDANRIAGLVAEQVTVQAP